MNKRKPSVRVSKPPARLLTLVNRPGGLLREEAIARSVKRLEAQRGAAQHAMLNLIDALETSAQGALTTDLLHDNLRLTDQLISLAFLFGNEQLAQVGERLCALLLALIALDEVHQEPVDVHIRALRLFAPPANPPERVVSHIHAGLDKILVRYGAQPGAS